MWHNWCISVSAFNIIQLFYSDRTTKKHQQHIKNLPFCKSILHTITAIKRLPASTRHVLKTALSNLTCKIPRSQLCTFTPIHGFKKRLSSVNRLLSLFRMEKFCQFYIESEDMNSSFITTVTASIPYMG